MRNTSTTFSGRLDRDSEGTEAEVRKRWPTRSSLAGKFLLGIRRTQRRSRYRPSCWSDVWELASQGRAWILRGL